MKNFTKEDHDTSNKAISILFPDGTPEGVNIQEIDAEYNNLEELAQCSEWESYFECYEYRRKEVLKKFDNGFEFSCAYRITDSIGTKFLFQYTTPKGLNFLMPVNVSFSSISSSALREVAQFNSVLIKSSIYYRNTEKSRRFLKKSGIITM